MSDDLAILRVNRSKKSLSFFVGRFFIKLDVRRKSIVTLALSQDNHFDCRKIVCKSGPYAASPASAYSNLHATECRVFELGLSTSIRNAQLSETLYPTELIGPH